MSNPPEAAVILREPGANYPAFNLCQTEFFRLAFFICKNISMN